MPLGKIIQNSPTHKEKKKRNKTRDYFFLQEVPRSIFCKGSLTVEAALVFPLFLYVMVGLLFLFRVLQVTQITYGALAATGSRISLEAGVREVTTGEVFIGFQKELKEADCPTQYIQGDSLGIQWKEVVLEGEYIELGIGYSCKIPVDLFGIRTIPIAQTVKVRKWTGARDDGAWEEDIDVWVYITPTGSVYHRERECTHLKLSIRAVGKEEALQEGYLQCLLCGHENAVYYYVTDEGKKYHTKLGCSGLKRTIYLIKLSEVEGRRACQRCGGG